MTHTLLEIDGSFHEGGGQILRTSLALSCLTGRPIRIGKIRANRPKPGLRAQHLACVQAAAEISRARVGGDAIGSSELVFEPDQLRAGDYRWAVGTAGAASLVFHTVVYPLAAASGPSMVRIDGGTHVQWAPTTDYLEQVWGWWYARLGGAVELSCERLGLFPKGGGRLTGRIHPTGPPLDELPATLERGPLGVVRLTSVAADSLPEHVARRQLEGATAALGETDVQTASRRDRARSPGTALLAVADYGATRAGFSALGRRGLPAEAVGAEAARQLTAFDAGGAALDEHMADQLLLPAALVAPGRAPLRYTTERVSGHLLTNAHTIGQFLTVPIEIEGAEGQPGTVRVG